MSFNIKEKLFFTTLVLTVFGIVTCAAFGVPVRMAPFVSIPIVVVTLVVVWVPTRGGDHD